jgi:hypothetical protein
MLVQQLLKNTSADHPDHSFLTQAYEAVKTLADHVNEKKRQEEERTGLYEAFSETKNCPTRLVSAKRRWLINIPCIEAKTKRDIQLMIFSDLIMLALPMQKSMFAKTAEQFQYRFVRWMDLLEMEVIEEGDLCVKLALDATNASFTRLSNTVANKESQSIPKDLLQPSIALQFPSLMSYNSFKTTLANESSKCKDEERSLLEERVRRASIKD